MTMTIAAFETHEPASTGQEDQASSAVEPSVAAQLLAAESNDPASLKARLMWGILGLLCLGACPELGLVAAGHDPRLAEFGRSDWLGTLSLPFSAALTLTLPLPGLLILLSMQDEESDLSYVMHALSRAFYRTGLLGLGATPVLALYALTGATPQSITVFATLGYFFSGGLALALLLRDLFLGLSRQRARSGFLLLGWGGFVSLWGLYLYLKLGQFV